MEGPARHCGRGIFRPASTVPSGRERALADVTPHSEKILRRWLIVTAFSVVAAFLVGGATRLTESGLSITEWKPVTGVVPPISAEAWQAAYRQYLQIPEARTVHAGITLAQFQSLYWWEWRIASRAAWWESSSCFRSSGSGGAAGFHRSYSRAWSRCRSSSAHREHSAGTWS